MIPFGGFLAQQDAELYHGGVSFCCLTEGRNCLRAWGSSKMQARPLDPKPALHKEAWFHLACGSSPSSQVCPALGSSQAQIILPPIFSPHPVPGLQPISPAPVWDRRAKRSAFPAICPGAGSAILSDFTSLHLQHDKQKPREAVNTLQSEHLPGPTS